MDHKHNFSPRRGQKSEQITRGALGNRGVSLSYHRSAHFYTTPTGGIRAICDAISSLRSEQEAAASCAALRLSLWKKRRTKAEDAYEEEQC